MKTYKDQVAIITGASSGIGRGLALALGKEGAKVALLARRRESLDEVVNQIERDGGQALAVPTDVTDIKAVLSTCNFGLDPR